MKVIPVGIDAFDEPLAALCIVAGAAMQDAAVVKGEKISRPVAERRRSGDNQMSHLQKRIMFDPG